jgi:hypothetical protein
MTHPPPSSPNNPRSNPRPLHKGMHPLVKLILFVPLILLAIPALAYGLFLACVLGYSALYGPIRWN